MNRCHGCGGDLEGGVVLHRSRLFCTLACALDHYDSEWVATRRAGPAPAVSLSLPRVPVATAS